MADEARLARQLPLQCRDNGRDDVADVHEGERRLRITDERDDPLPCQVEHRQHRAIAGTVHGARPQDRPREPVTSAGDVDNDLLTASLALPVRRERRERIILTWSSISRRAPAGSRISMSESSSLCTSMMRRITGRVSVGFCRGHETCCNEMSCTTSTRLCEASATAM